MRLKVVKKMLKPKNNKGKTILGSRFNMVTNIKESLIGRSEEHYLENVGGKIVSREIGNIVNMHNQAIIQKEKRGSNMKKAINERILRNQMEI